MVKTATKKRKQGGKRSRRRMTLRRGGNPHYDEETLNHVRAYIDNLTEVTPSKKAVLKANLETLPYDPNYIFFTPGVADPTNKKQQARDRINLALYGIVWFPSVSFPMNYPPQTMEKLTQFLLNEHRYLLTQTRTQHNIRRMDLVDGMLAHLNELPYVPAYTFLLVGVPEMNSDEERNETSPTRGYYQGLDRLYSVMQNRSQPWFDFQQEEQSDEDSSNESSPSPSSSEASSDNGWVNRTTNFVNGSPSGSEPEDDDPIARLANNPHSPSDSEPEEDDDPFARLANNHPSPSPSLPGSEDEADDNDERFRIPDLIYDNVVSEILEKYEMNENEYPENIQSLDLITGDLQPFNDAVRGDGEDVPLYDNVVFTLDGSNFVTVSRTRMINALTDNGNYLRFECEGQNIRQRRDDIPYALTGGVIGIPAGVVPLAQLKYVIENEHIALVYLEDANRTIDFMASPDNFGEHIFSGAHHCQEGTNQKVYNLNEVDIIAIAGGRRRHRKRKTLRKQRPCRLRHRKTSKK